MSTYRWHNVVAHWSEPINDKRTAISRIRDAVLNIDPVRFNFWGI